ncbi:MAG: phosphate ABC transporter permease subunit PstC [Armatimonadota bacterium]
MKFISKFFDQEKTAYYIFTVIALTTIAALFLIAFFIMKEGVPLIAKEGLFKFIFGRLWEPSSGVYGIYAMIIGSIWITIGAMVIGIPLGLACAIVLAEFASYKAAMVIKPALELLAGIPSVVYGFIGMVVLAPIIRKYLGGPGFSVLTASIVLGIMILPTIISISIDSLKAVPSSYREGSYALGATKWQTTWMVVLPAAGSGIIASIILGMGRAVGETMAVIMVAGNSIKVPHSILDPVRTLTSNIALEMGYATGDHQKALFATGVILFVMIMVLNIIANVALKRKLSKK